MNYIAIIGILVFIIIFLIYISSSNKGWNCTETGCVYVSGGSFDSYNKCNSYCKSNSNSENNSCGVNNVVQDQQPPVYQPYLPPIGYYHPSLYYHDNYWFHHKKDKRRDSNNNRNQNNIIINSPTGPVL
jgi:hypothetical protein